MTMTINVPVFPMRKEIANRKRSRALSFFSLSFGGEDARPAPSRYSRDGFEFDFSTVEKAAKVRAKADEAKARVHDPKKGRNG